MERNLRNPVLLLYIFEGGAPTFIKAEKFWPNVCATELDTSRKFYRIWRPSVDVQSQYFRDLLNHQIKRFWGVKYMEKSFEYYNSVFFTERN